MKATVKKCGNSMHIMLGKNLGISVGDEVHILTEAEYQDLTSRQVTPAPTPEEPILDIAKTIPAGELTLEVIEKWLNKTWLFSPAYQQRTIALADKAIEGFRSSGIY